MRMIETNTLCAVKQLLLVILLGKMVLYFTTTDILSISPLDFVMSGSMTNARNPSKRTGQGNNSSSTAVSGSAANGVAVGGGSAAPSNAAGNTNQAGSTSPLKAALVLKVNVIELLPIASHPFLTPLAKSVLRKFACLFYAEEKAKQMKSDPSYISSSVKKLEIVLQAMPEVQESQGFKTLRNNLTMDLEKNCAVIMQNYVLNVNDMNVEAKRERYCAAICKWIRGLAQAFIVQHGINNYNEDVAVIDLIASAPDNILVPLGITLLKYLAAYKVANQLQGGIPTPTVNFNFQNELNRINGTPQLAIEAQPATVIHLATGDNNVNRTETLFDKENNLEQEMMDATNAVETAAIGGRAATCRLIRGAIFKGTIKTIQKFHLQCKENDKTKQIKAAFTLPCLNKAAQHVGTIIANEPPAQMPVLRGLVQETAIKTTSAMECQIQSLEDQLKAVSCNTKAKKSRAMGRKRNLRVS
jgi:hypothetical protein